MEPLRKETNEVSCMIAVAHSLKTVSSYNEGRMSELRVLLSGVDTDWSSGKQLTEQFQEGTERL